MGEFKESFVEETPQAPNYESYLCLCAVIRFLFGYKTRSISRLPIRGNNSSDEAA